jgi:hypothetical protein
MPDAGAVMQDTLPRDADHRIAKKHPRFENREGSGSRNFKIIQSPGQPR